MILSVAGVALEHCIPRTPAALRNGPESQMGLKTGHWDSAWPLGTGDFCHGAYSLAPSVGSSVQLRGIASLRMKSTREEADLRNGQQLKQNINATRFWLTSLDPRFQLAQKQIHIGAFWCPDPTKFRPRLNQSEMCLSRGRGSDPRAACDPAFWLCLCSGPCTEGTRAHPDGAGGQLCPPGSLFSRAELCFCPGPLGIASSLSMRGT